MKMEKKSGFRMKADGKTVSCHGSDAGQDGKAYPTLAFPLTLGFRAADTGLPPVFLTSVPFGVGSSFFAQCDG
jgi:hypothetical protein